MHPASRIILTSEPDSLVSQTNEDDLFNTECWQRVLTAGFRSKACFLHHANSSVSSRYALTVFPAGPVKIGYLGFPLTNNDNSGHAASLINSFDFSQLNTRIHALRFSGHQHFSEATAAMSSEVTLETAIKDLQSWNAAGDAKLRRIVNRRKRTPLEIVDADSPEQANAIFELYKATVRKHHGSLRYTLAYFRSLVELSCSNRCLRCLLARDGAHTAGFHIVACHCGTAYYLHGGTNLDFRHLYPSDLLFLTAIEWAKAEGMREYNMLSSPVNQPELTRYKEKWGGTSSKMYTHTHALSPFMMGVFNHILRPANGLYTRTRQKIGL